MHRRHPPPGDAAVGRRPKACIACQRVKHKCVASPDVPGKCERCAARSEACSFGVPVQEDAWKQWATHEIQRLHEIVNNLGQRGDEPRRRDSPGPVEARRTEGQRVPEEREETPLEAAARPHIRPRRPAERLGSLGERLLIASSETIGPVLADVGSLDPRPSVVSKEVVSAADARTMVDFYLATLSASMYGFPLAVGMYPFLPADLTTLTPLLFGALCLVSAERIPTFHALVPALVKESAATNPVPDVPMFTDEDDPTIDIELGIGPEEITALAVLSMYAGDEATHGAVACARAALNWAKGLAKLDASPRETTSIGELCGFHTPRRSPSRQQSIRLILFAYVCRVHTAVLADGPAPDMDARELCAELAGLSSDDAERDKQLFFHAQLAYLFAVWVNASEKNTGDAALGAISALETWLVEATAARANLALMLPLYHYAHLQINLAGERARSDMTGVFKSQARKAATAVLESVHDSAREVPTALLPKIYIEAICLAGMVVLQDGSSRTQVSATPLWDGARGTPELDRLEAVALSLLSGPLPPHHWVPAAGHMLLTAVQHTRQATRFRYSPQTTAPA